jgi:uncharacterized protein YozE (UPF0346 family)
LPRRSYFYTLMIITMRKPVITETNRLLEGLEFSAYFVPKQTDRVHVCMSISHLKGNL